MSVKKALEEIAAKAAKNVGDLDASAGSGKGAVGGAAGRAAKKAGKKKTVKRLSIFDRSNTEGLFSKSGAFKEGAADAVPEAVRSLLQSPDGGPTLNDLTRKELKSLHNVLITSGNENLAHNLVKKTDKKKWTTKEIKQAENAQPLPDDGSDVLAKANPDPNDLNNTTGKPRKRDVPDVPVTKSDGEEVKAVDSNTFRKQPRPLPADDLYQRYVGNGIKDVDLKNQLDALFKSPGLQAAYRADRGLDDTASIFRQGRILSDDYKAWILERAGDGGVEFFNKAYAGGKQTVPRRNAVTPKNRYDKVTTPNEQGVSSASKLAGADVGAPARTEDFARRTMTEANVDPSELTGANITANGRKQATLPTDAKRQMGVEDLVQGLRDDASPEVLRIIAEGSDVESSEMAYKVVEAFLNRRIPTGDRVSETAHRAAVQAGADALAASLNRPPYTELHPSILDANNAATRFDIESGKQPVKGQPVETSGGVGNSVTPGSRAGALDTSQTKEMGNARQRNTLIRQVAAEQGLEPNDVNRILRSKRVIQVKDAEGNLIEVPQANAESLYILASRGQDLMDWEAHAKIQQQLATGTFPTNKGGADFADGTSLGDGTPKPATTDATVTQQPQIKPQEKFGPLGTKFDPENNVYHKYLRDGPRKIKNQKDYNNLLSTSDKVELEDEAVSVGFKNTKPRGISKKARQQLDEQNFTGDENAAPVWEDGSLKKDAKAATKALKDNPDLLEPVPESLKTGEQDPVVKSLEEKDREIVDSVIANNKAEQQALTEEIVSPSKKAPKKAAPKSQPEVRDPNVDRAAKNPAQVSAAREWLKQNDIETEWLDDMSDHEVMDTFFSNYKAADAAPDASKGTTARKPRGKKQTEQPVEEATGQKTQGKEKTDQTVDQEEPLVGEIIEFGPSAGPDPTRQYPNQSQYPGRRTQDTGTPKTSEDLLTPFEVRPKDTGKYPDKPIPTRRDYKKGRSFDNDVDNARVDKTVDGIEKWTTRGTITAAGLSALYVWMTSQGMSGDDEAATLSDGMGEKGDNPAMPLGPDPGGRKGPAAGTGAGGAGGAGMSRLERIRAAQGDRYVAGLPSTRPVRGY